MTKSALLVSPTDPTPIFEIFRGNYGSELLTAAVVHFDVFQRLARQPLAFETLRQELELSERAAMVLVTALRAFGLVVQNAHSQLTLSELGRAHLTTDAPFEVRDYLGLAADSPGVTAMVERLRADRPSSVKTEEGIAFIYRQGIESAMEQEEAARRLTFSLAGRAKNVAPLLAEHAPLAAAQVLLDVGGGSGIYSIACLQKYPHLRAIVCDRPAVLKVAAEMAVAYGVAERLECLPGDMFVDPVPAGIDTVLLSNVLHDWDTPACCTLVARLAAALPRGGQMLIHDVFLDDTLDGPLPIALYSAALFSLTEGRAYSGAEYRVWLSEAGLLPGPIIPTRVHCGVLPAVKQ